jgi:hypothetical protein
LKAGGSTKASGRPVRYLLRVYDASVAYLMGELHLPHEVRAKATAVFFGIAQLSAPSASFYRNFIVDGIDCRQVVHPLL